MFLAWRIGIRVNLRPASARQDAPEGSATAAVAMRCQDVSRDNPPVTGPDSSGLHFNRRRLGVGHGGIQVRDRSPDEGCSQVPLVQVA